jgi:hypothetical protein
MMCLINFDEFAIHVSIAARSSRLSVHFSEKVNNLLDRLDTQCMMHIFQCDTFKWVHGNQNDVHCCSAVMLHGL